MKKLINFFKSQRGAMFSMDARVALVVASVLAGAISVQVVQKIQRDRIAATEGGVLELMIGLENYYRATIPATVPDSFNDGGTDDFESAIIDDGYVDNASLVVDAWGNDWTYDYCETTRTIDGITRPIFYAVIYSHGPDEANDSAVTADFLPNGSTCASSFGAWQPENDDIGAKFTSIDVERERVARHQRQAKEVIDALQAYETGLFLDNQRHCASVGNPGGDKRCNWDTTGGNEYDLGEEARMNYYPSSTLDAGDSATPPNNYYYEVYALGTGSSYDPGSANGMRNFVELLGLPTEYATDPWGNSLCYDSNSTDRDEAPFLATIKYDNTCP